MKRLVFSLFKKFDSSLQCRGLGKIPGVMTLYNFAYNFLYDAFKPKGIFLLDIQGNKMYVNSGDKSVVPSLLMHGYYERYETEIFKKIIKHGMTVVILGANFGYYTLIAAKLVGDSGEVYAFEPEPNNYDLLVKNININNFTNVTSYSKAISNIHRTTKLFIDKVNLGDSSLSEDNVPQKKGFVEVETITLDEFFENVIRDNRIDFIQMDTQGAEGLIVEGAGKILKNNNLKVMMEFWPYGLKNLGTDPLKLLHKLQNYGFKIKLIDGANHCIKYVKPMKIVEICKKKDGKGYVNLLLEK